MQTGGSNTQAYARLTLTLHGRDHRRNSGPKRAKRKQKLVETRLPNVCFCLGQHVLVRRRVPRYWRWGFGPVPAGAAGDAGDALSPT